MDISKYFKKSHLIPVIVQEKGSKEVLMLAYMNEESLNKTMESGYTWFFSRSRNELWNKGATSGNVQKVVSITPDCDDDTLLIEVEQTGPACHTGNKSCFYKAGELLDKRNMHDIEIVEINEDNNKTANKINQYNINMDLDDPLRDLYQVVMDRKSTFTEGSYTCYLFEKGLDKILKKCGEECSEVIIAAKNYSYAKSGEKDRAQMDVKDEICDLIYHLTVLMVNEDISLDEIYEILKERSKKIGNLKKFYESNHNS